MNRTSLRIAMMGLVISACTNTSSPPAAAEQNGFLIYSADRVTQTIPCDGRPVQLNGSHTSLRLTGPCRFVRLAGEHNDISVELAHGGAIEVTGAHNDVTWSQIQPGPAPSLVDKGSSNSFHRGRA